MDRLRAAGGHRPRRERRRLRSRKPLRRTHGATGSGFPHWTTTAEATVASRNSTTGKSGWPARNRRRLGAPPPQTPCPASTQSKPRDRPCRRAPERVLRPLCPYNRPLQQVVCLAAAYSRRMRLANIFAGDRYVGRGAERENGKYPAGSIGRPTRTHGRSGNASTARIMAQCSRDDPLADIALA